MTRARGIALLCALACGLCPACGGDDDAGPGAEAGARDDGGGAGVEGGTPARDATIAPPIDASHGDATTPDAGGDGAPAAACADDEDDGGATREPLAIEVPAEAPVDRPFIVAVSTLAGSVLSTTATLCVDGAPAGEIRLYRGRGSAPLTLSRAGTVTLRVAAPEARAERSLTVAARPELPVSAVLPAGGVRWNADSDPVLEGDVQVPVGTTLTIEAGTRVLLRDLAALQVAGTLRITGTAEAPVLFTRAGEAAWGGVELLSGSIGELTHAWFTGGGGDSSRAFGHSASQPVIWAIESDLQMSAGGVVDNPGKAFGSRAARIRLDGVLVSRCDTGGELRASEVLISRGHVLEMPDADGRAEDDDNDGIYMLGAATDASGAPIESLIRDTVFAIGEDDAIDHNGAQLRVERLWIEGFLHEGLAGSAGNRLHVLDSVVRDCGQGVEAGYGMPEVIVEHSLMTENGVGVRFGDSYDRDTTGSMTVRHSISIGNDINVRNHVNQLGGPLAGAIRIDCSMVDSPDFDGVDANLAGSPSGAWQTRGCADGPQLVGEGCDGTPPGPRTCF